MAKKLVYTTNTPSASTDYAAADGTWKTMSGGGGGGGPQALLHGVASGTDTYTVSLTGVSSYADGDAYLVRFTNGNTTGCTLNVNSLGAKTLYRNNDGALIGGDIVAGGEMLCIYSSSINGFQVIGTAPNTLLAYVTNAETTTITKGQPVYAFGGTGDRLKVKLAYNTSDSTSAQTVGLVISSSIAANQKGLIIVNGQLDGLSMLPTSTFADGDPVYLGSTAGTITNVKPSAPNHLVYLGFVTTASPGSAGRMYVRVQNGYELDEIHDVQVGSYGTKDVLWRDTSVNLWKNKDVFTLMGAASVSANGYLTSTDWSTFNGKENALTFSSPLSRATNTISIPAASASANGYLTSTNWSTFNGKQDAITGAASTVTTSNLTANRAVISNASGKIATNSVTDTELGYLSGVTSAIQTQLNSKIASSVSFINNVLAQALTGAATPTVRYHSLSGTVSSLTTAYQIPIPTACTFSNFYARIYSAQGASGSLVFTLQKNAVDTALVVTIAAGSAAGNFSDTSNTVTFAAGDTWQVKITQNATSGSTSMAGYSFKLSGL